MPLHHTHTHKNPYSRRKNATKVVVVLIIGFIAFRHLFSGPSTFAGNVADNILRPIFGEKKTLQIEAVYFSITEGYKKVKYNFVKPTNEFVTNQPSPLQKELNSGNMSLLAIPKTNSFQALAGEGIWQDMPVGIFPNEVVMAKTFIRPDPTKDYATVALVQLNMKKLMINVEAGIKHPCGTIGNPGPGFVPKTVQDSNTLLAVFNGGFQEKDGHYGMIVGTKTYVPLRLGLATLFIYDDGHVQIVSNRGQTIDKNVISIRQNGPMLVEDGKVTQFIESGSDTWGATTTNSLVTWRSGIGITKEGNLIFAAGESLVPATLAKALLDAGAVNAMQLDINSTWVRFILFTPKGNGTYTYEPLLKNMVNGGNDYLHGYGKDFFYVYKK